MTINEALRKVAPIRQVEFAEILGITPQSAGAILRRGDAIKLSTLLNILDHFGATLSITTKDGQVLEIDSF